MNVEKYLQGFFPGTKGPTLDAMKYFMEKLGHPEEKLKFIHIAGTNGKGSCTEMMTNIFLKSHLLHLVDSNFFDHKSLSFFKISHNFGYFF